MNKSILITALLIAVPAQAHCYSVWSYPWPQKCHTTTLTPKNNYYVEITSPPPDPQPASPAVDQRTPEQMQEQIDHDIAVQMHKSDINKLMIILFGD
jgi:hypothetical protein